MRSPMTKSLAAGMLAAASLAAGAQTLLTQIPLASFSGDYSDVDVAVNSATNRIYVPIQFNDFYNGGYNYFRVFVIDGATNQIVHKLEDFPGGNFYWGVAIDPVRNFTYVEMGNYLPDEDQFTQCTVSVVDGRTEETVKTISLPAGDCGKMVVDPVTGKVYVRAHSELDVIESEATGSIKTFSLPTTSVYNDIYGNGLAVSPYIHRLYFTYNTNGGPPEYLGFFDTLDEQITKEMLIDAPIDYYPTNPVINPATGHIFGIYQESDYDTGINNEWGAVYDSSGRPLATINFPGVKSPILDDITGTDVDPKKNLTFVSAFTETQSSGGKDTGTALYVIDGVSNTVSSSTTGTVVSPTNEPQGGKVAVNPDTSKVYVTYCDNMVITNPDSSVDGTFYLNVYSEQ